jgi:hypothetical protein
MDVVEELASGTVAPLCSATQSFNRTVRSHRSVSAFCSVCNLKVVRDAHVLLRRVLGPIELTIAGNCVSKPAFTILSAVTKAERDRTLERIIEV